MTTPGVSVKHNSGGVTIEIPIFRSDSLLAAKVIELQAANKELERASSNVRGCNDHLTTVNAAMHKDIVGLRGSAAGLREQNQRLHALLHATPPIQSIDAQAVKDNRELRAEIKRLTEAGIGTIGELVAALDNLQQANRRVAKLREVLKTAQGFIATKWGFTLLTFPIKNVLKETE